MRRRQRSLRFSRPDRAADGIRARREGGLQRSRPANVFPLEVPDASLKNSLDVSSLLAESINAVPEGRLDPRVSNAIGCLAGILLRALEQGPTEERLARLETILEIAGNSQTGKLWIESLHLPPKSKAHIRGMIRLLWEYAMWSGIIPVQRNPMELVTVKNATKRLHKPRSLTVAEFQKVICTPRRTVPYRGIVVS